MQWPLIFSALLLTVHERAYVEQTPNISLHIASLESRFQKQAKIGNAIFFTKLTKQ